MTAPARVLEAAGQGGKQHRRNPDPARRVHRSMDRHMHDMIDPRAQMSNMHACSSNGVRWR